MPEIYDYKPALGIYDPGQELQGQAGLENTLAALNAGYFFYTIIKREALEESEK